MMHYTQITRRDFYADGGFSNPRLVRKQKGRSWSYWRRDGGDA